jgi:hypothetical protein
MTIFTSKDLVKIGEFTNDIEDVETLFGEALEYAHQKYDPCDVVMTYNHLIVEYLASHGFIIKKEH